MTDDPEPGARHTRGSPGVFRREVDAHLTAFPVTGVLHYLNQRGLWSRLCAEGVPADPEAGCHFGRRKMEDANLGMLYALGKLDMRDEHYVLPDASPLSESDLAAAGSVLDTVGQLGAPGMPLPNGGLERTPEEIRRGLSLPIISQLRLKAEAGGIKRTDLAGKVAELLQGKRMTHVADTLGKLGLLVNGSLTKAGRALLEQRLVADFGRLINSYTPLILHLHDAEKDPEKNAFGREYGRDQYENAIASNQLIANAVGNLSRQTDLGERTVLDLGSGGGYFLLALAARSVLFDISSVANAEAERTFDEVGRGGQIAGVINGDITNPSDLWEARETKPDAVTINYILHDIAGQAPSYQQGLERVTEFLHNYRRVFGKTLLYVTESWDVSWEALRAGGKSYITLYTWLHGISPQRLFRKTTFSKLLEEAGFAQEASITHGRMIIDGVMTPINETIVARAL